MHTPILCTSSTLFQKPISVLCVYTMIINFKYNTNIHTCIIFLHENIKLRINYHNDRDVVSACSCCYVIPFYYVYTYCYMLRMCACSSTNRDGVTLGYIIIHDYYLKFWYIMGLFIHTYIHTYIHNLHTYIHTYISSSHIVDSV